MMLINNRENKWQMSK